MNRSIPIAALVLFMVAKASAETRVTGPISTGTHGWPEAASFMSLKDAGYSEAEYFVEGQASRFAPVAGAALGMDGRWNVRRLDPEPYKTRIIVRRPVDERKFNGTVVVEWLQSQGGYDKDVFWIWVHEAILRDGYAWVGVTADRQALTGLAAAGAITSPPGSSPDGSRGLVRWDSERYSSLNLSSEDLGYDIFSQVGQLIGPRRAATANDPMGGLKVERLLAVGATGSSVRLLTYYNAVQPIDKIFDGFLLHARIYPQAEQLGSGLEQPPIVHARTDLQIPMIVTNNEGEAVRHLPARQPESAFYRLWETVGGFHTNAYWNPKFATATSRDFGGQLIPPKACAVDDIPTHFVDSAALVALNRWTSGGSAAPHFPPIAFAGAPPVAEKDGHGNAKGGIPLPEITVPVARYEGRMAGGCDAITPFSRDQLQSLYPTFDTYASKYNAAVAEAVKAGFLLQADAEKELDAMNRRRSIFQPDAESATPR